MPLPDPFNPLIPFTDDDKTEAELVALDIENRRAADFVVNMAGVIRDLRRRKYS